jgi:hypothetical protein
MEQHDANRSWRPTASPDRPTPAWRSAGFQTCRIADFQIGRACQLRGIVKHWQIEDPSNVIRPYQTKFFFTRAPSWKETGFKDMLDQILSDGGEHTARKPIFHPPSSILGPTPLRLALRVAPFPISASPRLCGSGRNSPRWAIGGRSNPSQREQKVKKSWRTAERQAGLCCFFIGSWASMTQILPLN